jgi:hypothetical protein
MARLAERGNKFTQTESLAAPKNQKTDSQAEKMPVHCSSTEWWIALFLTGKWGQRS